MTTLAPRVYLDHAATTDLSPAARGALVAALAVRGNPSSVHTSGRRARAVLEEARESLAASLGAHPTEIVLTSGGTEADNLAVLGAVRARVPEGRDRAVVSATEHAAIAELAGVVPVDLVPVSSAGQIDVAALRQLVVPGTAVVSVQWVNNETGVVQPVDDVVAAAGAAGAWSHSDAVQAVGHVPVAFAASGLDLMTVSAHKVGGPVGIGALLVRRGIELAAVTHGGGQERKLRSGTQQAALAAGFAAAVAEVVAGLEVEAPRLAQLRDRLWAGIRQVVPDAVRSGAEPLSPAILNVTVPDTRSADLVFLLDRAGIDCSTGSACHAGVTQPSEVLLAMGRSPAAAASAVRFSFGAGSTAADVDAVLAALPDAVARARAAYSV